MALFSVRVEGHLSVVPYVEQPHDVVHGKVVGGMRRRCPSMRRPGDRRHQARGADTRRPCNTRAQTIERPSRAALQSTTPLIRPRCQRTLPGWKSPCVRTRSEESEGRRAVTALTAAAVRGWSSPAGGCHVSTGGGGVSAPAAPSNTVSCIWVSVCARAATHESVSLGVTSGRPGNQDMTTAGLPNQTDSRSAAIGSGTGCRYPLGTLETTPLRRCRTVTVGIELDDHSARGPIECYVIGIGPPASPVRRRRRVTRAPGATASANAFHPGCLRDMSPPYPPMHRLRASPRSRRLSSLRWSQEPALSAGPVFRNDP